MVNICHQQTRELFQHNRRQHPRKGPQLSLVAALAAALLGLLCGPIACSKRCLLVGQLPSTSDAALWSHLFRGANPVRRCEVLIQPSPPFDQPYAVWISEQTTEQMAQVFVATFSVEHVVEKFSAPLDSETGTRLGKLCSRAVKAVKMECASSVYDGIWYRVAGNVDANQVEAVGFLSPKEGTVSFMLVGLARALRNYATTPESPTIKRELLRDLEKSEFGLARALGDKAYGGFKL